MQAAQEEEEGMDEDSTPDKADPSQEDSPADAPAEAAAVEEPSAAAAEGAPQAAQTEAPSLNSGLALLAPEQLHSVCTFCFVSAPTGLRLLTICLLFQHHHAHLLVTDTPHPT